MGYELIKIQELHDKQVGEIVLSKPPANILSAAMMSELTNAVREIASWPHAKLIIISGEGEHFCYGASVEEHQKAKVRDMLPHFHKTIREIIATPVPTLAKVSGRCLGGGFELALACTFCFAEETAAFSVPEILLSVFPPVACALLPLKTNQAVASQIILSGRMYGAEELRFHGFVNEVAKGRASLDGAVDKFIEKIVKPKSASAFRIAHAASRMALLDHYDNYIGKLEKLYLEDLMSTKDAVEGIEAFLAKREPVWKDA